MTFTCPHNLHAWPQPTLADLATQQYVQILQLKEEKQLLRDALLLYYTGDAGRAAFGSKVLLSTSVQTAGDGE